MNCAINEAKIEIAEWTMTAIEWIGLLSLKR